MPERPARAFGRRTPALPRALLPAMALAMMLALALAGPARAQERWGRVLYVNDGDTLTLNLEGRRELVRLLGIDAPETGHSRKLERAARKGGRSLEQEEALGSRARARLMELAPPGARLRVETDPQAPARDQHERLLAYLHLPGGGMLNAMLLEEGLAAAYRRCGCRELKRFTELERRARARGLGVWAAPGP